MKINGHVLHTLENCNCYREEEVVQLNIYCTKIEDTRVEVVWLGENTHINVEKTVVCCFSIYLYTILYTVGIFRVWIPTRGNAHFHYFLYLVVCLLFLFSFNYFCLCSFFSLSQESWNSIKQKEQHSLPLSIFCNFALKDEGFWRKYIYLYRYIIITINHSHHIVPPPRENKRNNKNVHF